MTQNDFCSLVCLGKVARHLSALNRLHGCWSMKIHILVRKRVRFCIYSTLHTYKKFIYTYYDPKHLVFLANLLENLAWHQAKIRWFGPMLKLLLSYSYSFPKTDADILKFDSLDDLTHLNFLFWKSNLTLSLDEVWSNKLQEQ